VGRAGLVNGADGVLNGFGPAKLEGAWYEINKNINKIYSNKQTICLTIYRNIQNTKFPENFKLHESRI
jgi:hypothetical protein